MPVKNYYTVDGEIFGETEGGVSRNYVRDALGSVVAMTDTANTKLYEARYKPYGGVLSSTGTAPDWTWNGVWGYLKAAGSVHNEFSVRARFYADQQGRWTSVDPLWPDAHAFRYARTSPCRYIDPSGLAACDSSCCSKEKDDAFYDQYSASCPGGTWVNCDDPKGDKQNCLSWIEQNLDCNLMKRFMQAIVESCNFFSGGGSYGDDGKPPKLQGLTHCCTEKDGTVKRCGYRCCSSATNENDCWNFCLKKHEEYHSKDCKRIEGGTPSSNYETCAYAVQAKCLYGLLSGACGWSHSDFPRLDACLKSAKNFGCPNYK